MSEGHSQLVAIAVRSSERSLTLNSVLNSLQYFSKGLGVICRKLFYEFLSHYLSSGVTGQSGHLGRVPNLIPDHLPKWNCQIFMLIMTLNLKLRCF